MRARNRVAEVVEYAKPVVVVCDVPSIENYNNGLPIAGNMMQLFQSTMSAYGFVKDDFVFLSPCPPMPSSAAGSAKREGEFLAKHRDRLLADIRSYSPIAIIFMGATAGRQVMGRAVKITKQRGSITTAQSFSCPVFPMLSPGHVLRKPELIDIFKSDAGIFKKLKDSGWKLSATDMDKTTTDYRWCLDLSELLDLHPKAIAVDSETTGLSWFRPEVVPLTIQFCYKPGHALVVPVDCDYYPELSGRKRVRLIKQIKQIMEDETIAKAGHNFKYDEHILNKLGIVSKNWATDTQTLAFCVDENMQEKSLAECIRRWIPAMSGYSDVFDRKTDKSNMRAVSHIDMLNYGGGDADAGFRLAQFLVKKVKEDQKQFNCHERVIMPSLRTFQSKLEKYGILVNTDALSDLQKVLDEQSEALNKSLMSQVPSKVKRKHVAEGKPLKFSRAAFIIDTLFTKDGMGLKPVKFTKSTERLPDKEKIPSTSSKDHLPYFEHIPFVSDLMKFQKLEKVRGTYVGVPDGPDGPTGFWKHLYNNEVRPSYMLHRVVTGRSSSDSPNGQNLPKRGEIAKAYRKIFIPRPGYVFGELDLSQAELRIAAWMANEHRMIRVYIDGGDIHSATAASTMGMGLDRFMSFDGSEDLLLDHANSINGSGQFLRNMSPGKRKVATLGDFFAYKRYQAKACIAKDSVVKTRNRGDVAIQDIVPTDYLWDGIRWVTSDGVEYQGDRYTMEWSGVRATPEHIVFTEEGAMPIYLAAESGLSIIKRLQGKNDTIRFYYGVIEDVGYLKGKLDEKVTTQRIVRKAKEYKFADFINTDNSETAKERINARRNNRKGYTAELKKEATYDIVNSGDQHRFAFANGCIVAQCNFGFLYGMWWRGFQTYAKTDYGIEFTDEEAQEMRENFFFKYPDLLEWHRVMKEFCHEHGYVRALHGARRNLPSIWSNDKGVVSQAERNCINSPVQRFGSDLGLIAQNRAARDCDEDIARPIAFIHDANIWEFKIGYEEEYASNVKWYMENPPLKEWFGIEAPLPILADVSLGPDLGSMVERKDIQSVKPEWYNEEADLV